MLVIRLFRVGKRNQPSFKIVVAEKKRSSTSGRFIEEVGFYNPLTKEKVLRTERIKYWISVGAKPLDTVHNLLVSEKIIEGKKIDVHKKPKKEKEVAPEKIAEAKTTEETAKPEEKKEKPSEKPSEEPSKEEVAKEIPKEETPKTE